MPSSKNGGMKEEENKKESKEERKESPGMEKEEEERNKVISLDAKPLQGSPCQSPLPAISDHFTQHLKWPLLVTHSRASLQGCFHPTWRLCVYDAVVEFFFTSFFFFFSPTHKSAESSSSPRPHRWARVRIVGPPKKRR